jgi:DNA-binding CsgD family transcriptional regulator
VDGALVGRGGALFVVGDAGLGKTSVLEHACRFALSREVLVGLGRGDVMEASLPFGLLSQALVGLGGEGVLRQDLLGSSVEDDRAAQSYRVLRWMERLATAPVLVALDDLHWSDADSLALVSYLCRRMSSVPVGLIATLRPWPPGPYELAMGLAGQGFGTVERLAALSEDAAGGLLAERVGRRPADETVRQCCAMSAGNPLLLEQLAEAVRRGEDIARSAGPGHRPASEELLLARFAGLPEPGMRCAQAASVLGTRFVPAVAAEVAKLGESEADLALDALGRSGLIRETAEHEVEFVHPLFRQALYEDLGAGMRGRLHERAFSVLANRGMDAEAAEHAVRANLVGNLDAIAVLERAGRAARRAGATDAAARRFQAAVDLAGDRARPELLLGLGEALSAVGCLADALAVFGRVLGDPELIVELRVEGLWMLARTLHVTGAHDQAARRFGEAIDLAESYDHGLAVEILLEFAMATWMTAGPARSLPLARRAREIAGDCDRAIRMSAAAIWGYVAIQTGDPGGIEVLAAAALPLERDLAANAPGAANPWGPLASWAFGLALLERLDEADRLLLTARSAAERLGAPQSVAMHSITHAYVLARQGRLAEALELLGAVRDLCDLVPLAEASAALGHAYVLLYMGRLAESGAWCEKGEAIARLRGEWHALVFLLEVRAHRRLREGHPAEACDHYAELEAIMSRTGLSDPSVPPWGRHAVAAYVAAGRLDDASRVIGWLDRHAEPLPCRWPRIAAECGRGRLAEHHGDHGAAEVHFRAAMLLHDQIDMPVEKVETLLDYGAYLRRSGRPALARPLLHDAVELAEACGARWLVDLAGQELAVAGGRRRRRAEQPDGLTGQERRVAGLAAAGRTNGDIGRELHLSVSTIETHLEHIYAKLNIHSRRELMMAARIDANVAEARKS